jgi:D-hydantoinase
LKNSQNRILIKGGRVVNHDQLFYADVYIEDGMIREVGENLIVPGGIKTIEARGKFVLPGGIDADTHLEQIFMGARTADDFATATRAAVAGGTTCVLSSVREHRSVSLSEAVAAARERASTKACCDYSFHVCVSSFTDKVAREMETCVREHGVNSFLVYMTYRELLMLREEELLRVIKKCKELGCVAMIHAESGDLVEECAERVRALGVTGPEGHLLSRPEQLEAEATQRAISVAEELNCPLYIVNVMSKASALAIANAKRRGVVVYGEALTAGLATDGSHYFDKVCVSFAFHMKLTKIKSYPKSTNTLLI